MNWFQKFWTRFFSFHKHDFRVIHKGATEIVFVCCECGSSKKIEIQCDHEWTVRTRTFVEPQHGITILVGLSKEERALHERLTSGSMELFHECEKCHQFEKTTLKGVPNLKAFR